MDIGQCFFNMSCTCNCFELDSRQEHMGLEAAVFEGPRTEHIALFSVFFLKWIEH
jgi:hypothetical protein